MNSKKVLEISSNDRKILLAVYEQFQSLKFRKGLVELIFPNELKALSKLKSMETIEFTLSDILEFETWFEEIIKGGSNQSSVLSDSEYELKKRIDEFFGTEKSSIFGVDKKSDKQTNKKKNITNILRAALILFGIVLLVFMVLDYRLTNHDLVIVHDHVEDKGFKRVQKSLDSHRISELPKLIPMIGGGVLNVDSLKKLKQKISGQKHVKKYEPRIINDKLVKNKPFEIKSQNYCVIQGFKSGSTEINIEISSDIKKCLPIIDRAKRFSINVYDRGSDESLDSLGVLRAIKIFNEMDFVPFHPILVTRGFLSKTGVCKTPCLIIEYK